MAISTRSDALAPVEETTEGVAKAPVSGTEFVALQDDFSMTPAFDTLENAERLNSLGKAKSLLGLENPTASTSHYWRGSGVEGTAPNYAPFLKACLGTQTSGLTERDVVSATTTTITYDTGEGPEYPLGRPQLIKDGVNGHSVRWSTGNAGDVVSLGFPLTTAPAAGVLTGDPVYWSPLNDATHPTLSIWHYIGNSVNGALELMTGSRTTSVDVTADAGGFINASYSLEGIEYFFDPKINSATEVDLDFTDDGGALVATIAAKTYKDPIDVAKAVEAAFNAASAETYTCTYSSTDGKYTIATSTSTIFELDFATGPNLATSAAAFIGYAATDLIGATTYTSDAAQDFSTGVTPTFDAADPLVAKSNEVLLGEGDDEPPVCFEASSVGFTITMAKTDILSVCSESGKSGSVMNEREVTITLVSLLDNYEAENFHRFHTNQEIRFQWTAGVKVAGNLQPGKTVSAYAHSATITEFEVTSEENLATLNMTLTTFVNSDGDGEFFIGSL